MRVTALGGISEIGRNMTVFEHLGRLLIVDCGVLFPRHDEPGVDLILPDLRLVEDRLDDVEALVLTHAHEDHIGAIPFLLKLRPDIPVVGSKFTLALVAEKCREHRIKPVFVEVGEGQSSTHGVFECEYFHVNHSIPGCLAIASTPARAPCCTPATSSSTSCRSMTSPPTCPACHGSATPAWTCSSAIRRTPRSPGVGPSESEVGPTLHRLIRGAEGRVIVACFASNVDRVQQIIDAAVALGRGCRSSAGRWCATWVSPGAGLPHVDEDDLIDIGAAEMMAPERVVLITTGTQGEPMSALSRMSRGEHRSITLTSGDLIILSSSLIPGNEEAVYGVMDSLAKIGARVVTNAQARVHVSGHAYSGELLFLYNGVRPRNVMPVHGTWRMLRANAALATRSGVDPEAIMLAENGVSVDLVAGKARIAGAVPTGKMFVDGLITGDVGDATLGERLTLSSGFVAVTVVVHRGTGRAAAPRTCTRGASPRTPRRSSPLREGGGGAGSSCRRTSPKSPASLRRYAARSASGWGRPTAASR